MDKLQALKDKLLSYNKLCICFSGGVDSTFLLALAKEVLNENVIAVLVDSDMVARTDLNFAKAMANELGVKIYTAQVSSNEDIESNTTERCYYCKKNVYSKIREIANGHSFGIIADGKNIDDGKVFRPGSKAAVEVGAVSPLFESGFSKEDIRHYSRIMGLKTWDKPSNSCLATRIPYNTKITKELLNKIEKSEDLFHNMGMYGVRVRVHDIFARIEAPTHFHPQIILQKELVEEIKKIGFKYVTLDLEGFRSGSFDN